MPDGVDAVIQAIGTVCEMAALIRDHMEENGFSHEEAVTASIKYILNVLGVSGKGERKDE